MVRSWALRAEGLTQAQIAALIGRSQPEVRFHGRSPPAMKLRRRAREARALIGQSGGSHVRVFGRCRGESSMRAPISTCSSTWGHR